MRSWWWAAALLAALLLLAVACEEEEEAPAPTPTPTPAAPAATPPPTPPPELKTDFGVTDTEIILGVHAAQSGPAGGFYAPYVPAFQAYLAKVNQEDGGVCDRNIVLKAEDDQYSPALGLEAARKLVERERVLAFTGNVGTPPNTGSVDYINDPNGDGDTSDGIPDLFMNAAVIELASPERPWSVIFLPDYASEGNVLASYINQNFPGKTAGLLYQNDDAGKAGRAGFKEAFEGQIVLEQSYEATATDITSEMANLRSANPDVLHMMATILYVVHAFRYMEANDWHPQVAMSYVSPPSLVASVLGGGDIQAGFQKIAGTITTNFALDPVVDQDHPAMIEHKRIMESYGGPPLSLLSVLGQSIGELAVETLKRACDNNDMTRAGVLKAALSIQGFRTSLLDEGIFINLSETDRFALQAMRPAVINADGTFTRVGEVMSTE